MAGPDKVDLIYTWVDGCWPGHFESRQKYAAKPLDMNPERYRDIHQCLRFSLRSAERYLPWVDKIHIVTERPQVPPWLNVDHPRIRLVHHDEFIADRHLPTFNSNVIESCLHRLPDLNEHFISMCDDFFFFKDTPLSTFWNNGKYTVPGSLIGENNPWRIRYHSFYGLGFIEHGPHFASKTNWRNMTEFYPDEMEATRTHRFRQPDDLVTLKLYRWYMLRHHRRSSYAIPYWKYKKFFSFNMIENNVQEAREKLEALEELRPNAFCLNDDQEDNPNQEVLDMVQTFLEKHFPEPSAFEKPGA